MRKSLSKRLLVLSVIFLTAMFGGLAIHWQVIQGNYRIGFQLHEMYYFFGIAGLLTYYVLELANKFVPSKVPYAFLTCIVMKLGVFMMLFLGGKFQLDTASMASRVSVVIPLFLFLALEGLATYLVLQSKDQ